MPGCCVLDAAMTNDAGLATLDDALTGAARRFGLVVLPQRVHSPRRSGGVPGPRPPRRLRCSR